MTHFAQTLRYVVGQLYLERRISIRRLRQDLQLDDATLGDLRHELTVTKQIAVEVDGEVLMWAPATDSEGVVVTTTVVERVGDEATTGETSSTVERVAEAERRQLTVAFFDLVGSTALSTTLDPEDLRDVITSFQDTCRVATARYSGFVARYMGDGMLVYFGYPQAHEDDAERAVRAGLDVLSAMADLNAAVDTGGATELAVRIGIATGPVVVGDLIGEGAAEEAAVIGETPNLAARLQGLAKPDQLVVSTPTRRLAGEVFVYEDLGLHELKGIAEPTQAWGVAAELDSALEDGDRGEVHPTALVGRHEELGLLQRAWDHARTGNGQCVLLSGEAGVGKSRLLEALREYAAADTHVWVSLRCSPYHSNTPLYPVIEHLKRVAGWQSTDDDARRLEKLEQALSTQALPVAEVLPYFADLMSLSLEGTAYQAPANLSAQQYRDATLDAVVGWLLDLADRQPVLQVCEDLHWADPTTLELLGLYIEQTPTVAMLTLLTHRPDFTPPWPMRSHMTPITLNRLERADVETMVRNRAGGKRLPAEVLEHIIAKADGVPLYVEELTKTILDAGILRETDEAYVLDHALEELQIPDTLQDSLMARLDRLPALKELAQMGAVLGREFAYEMLAALSDFNEPDLNSGLDQLVSDELFFQRGRPPRARYIFKHALIQDAAYQSLLKRSRQTFHRKVAELLTSRFDATASAQPALVAQHFAAAGDHAEAAARWTTAGHQAMAGWATAEATSHFENALTMLAALPHTTERGRQELEIQTALGPALLASKGFGDPALGTAYQRAAELCEKTGTSEQTCLMLRGLQIYHFAKGELTRSVEIAARLARHAQSADHKLFQIGACHATGQSLFLLGELDEASKVLEHGLALVGPTPVPIKDWPGGQPAEQCHLYAGFVRWVQGDTKSAIAHAERGLAWSEMLGNPISLVNAEVFVATLFTLCRDIDRASLHAERTVKLASEHGHPTFLPWGQVLQGAAVAAKSDPVKGLEIMEEGLNAYAALDLALWLPMLRAPLVNAYLRAGKVDKARALLASNKTTNERVWDALTRRLEGELLAADASTSTQARQLLEEAIQIATRQGARAFALRAGISLARACLSQREPKAGKQALDSAIQGIDQSFETADLRAAKALYAELES